MKVFGCRPSTMLAAGRTGAGVRKPPRKETASWKGRLRAAAIYGDLGVAGVDWPGWGMMIKADFEAGSPAKRRFLSGAGPFFRAGHGDDSRQADVWARAVGAIGQGETTRRQVAASQAV